MRALLIVATMLALISNASAQTWITDTVEIARIIDDFDGAGASREHLGYESAKRLLMNIELEDSTEVDVLAGWCQDCEDTPDVVWSEWRPSNLLEVLLDVHGVSHAVGEFRSTIARRFDIDEEYIDTAEVRRVFEALGRVLERQERRPDRFTMIRRGDAPVAIIGTKGSDRRTVTALVDGVSALVERLGIDRHLVNRLNDRDLRRLPTLFERASGIAVTY